METNNAESPLSPLGRFERLMLAADGSEHSAGAIRVAAEMVRQYNAHLTVMSVSVHDPETESLEPTMGTEADAMAQSNVDVACAALSGASCEKLIYRAPGPARGIAAAAEETRADVVIMSRRGRRGLARWMLGDITARTIGLAPCAVLVVPMTCSIWSKRILVATDGSRYGDAAAVAAGRMAQLCGLPLSVVSVTLPGHSEQRRDEAQLAIERVATAMAKEGVEVTGTVVGGQPDEVIVRTARDLGADLIVVGSHGRTGLDKVLMGSVSEKVLNQTVCPVLVVKS
jgi:nucleotide-binding universal stress UspA family protein